MGPERMHENVRFGSKNGPRGIQALQQYSISKEIYASTVIASVWFQKVDAIFYAPIVNFRSKCRKERTHTHTHTHTHKSK